MNYGIVFIKMSKRHYYLNLEEKIKIIVSYERLLNMLQREASSELSYYSQPVSVIIYILPQSDYNKQYVHIFL